MLRKLEIRTERANFAWFERFDHFHLDKIICSLRLPENRLKTIRWIDYEYNSPFATDKDTKDLYALVKVPFLYVHTYDMYQNKYLFCWTEDSLYKILDFDSTRCPSGGCDGESMHQYVGVTAEDAVNLIDLKLDDDTKKQIAAAFEKMTSLQNKCDSQE